MIDLGRLALKIIVFSLGIVLVNLVLGKLFNFVPLDILVSLFYHVNIALYLVFGWFLAPQTLFTIQGLFYFFIIVNIVKMVKWLTNRAR